MSIPQSFKSFLKLMEEWEEKKEVGICSTFVSASF